MTGVRLRLVRDLSWTREKDGTTRLLDPRRDAWVRMVPWTSAVLEGIEKGDSLEALIERAEGTSPQRVRRLVLDLEKAGYVRVEVAAPGTIAGRWRVERELGRGAVGIAYLCTDASTGERVVAKRAWDYLYPISTTSTLLRWEERVLRSVDHAGIVKPLALVEDGAAAVLVRGLAAGETLTERHDELPASVDEALRVAREVAQIVMHLHARGWLLVDAKPSNFFTDGGTVALADAGNCLGRAGEAPEGARPGGSRGFTPPEVVAGGAPDARSDVWGIGRLLAFVATGRLMRGEARLAPLLEGLPPPLVPLVETLCADEPTERPKDGAAVLSIMCRSFHSH